MKKKKLFLLIIITFLIILNSCSNIGNVILRKKWKLEEYDDWYLIVDKGEPVGYINYKLDRYYNESNEQRYVETTERRIYVAKKDAIEIKITKSTLLTDRDFNILQFQFYSSPVYNGDTERFNQGVIENKILKIKTLDGELIDIALTDKLPSILNYRYIIDSKNMVKAEVIAYNYFSIKYLTMIKENIVCDGEKEVNYKGEWVIAQKYLIMPYESTGASDSYYFNENGKLIMASIFQKEMYILLTTKNDIKKRFKL